MFHHRYQTLAQKANRPTRAVDLFTTDLCRYLCPVLNSHSFFQHLALFSTKSIIFHPLPMILHLYLYLYTPEKQESPFLYSVSTKGEFSNHTECSHSHQKRIGFHFYYSMSIEGAPWIQWVFRLCCASPWENCSLSFHVCLIGIAIGSSVILSRSPFLYR